MTELELHVNEGHIIVNVPGTRLTMTFEVSLRAPGLLEHKFWTHDDGNASFEGGLWTQRVRRLANLVG